MTKTLAVPVELVERLLSLIEHNINFSNHPENQLRALLAAPVVDAPVLDAPAQVGNTRFGKGIKWSTVIGCAQRYAEYMAEPEQEAARLARFAETLARVHSPSA